jgi:hypothetical protein
MKSMRKRIPVAFICSIGIAGEQREGDGEELGDGVHDRNFIECLVKVKHHSFDLAALLM